MAFGTACPAEAVLNAGNYAERRPGKQWHVLSANCSFPNCVDANAPMCDPNALASYNYDLPAGLIAQRPLPERDASRLLVLDRNTGAVAHRTFREFPELVRPHDLLVLNETRVIPARLVGRRTATGGKWEGLFLGVSESGDWRLIGQTRGKLQPGESITLTGVPAAQPGSAQLRGDPQDELHLMLIERSDDGEWTATPESDADPLTLLDRFGTVPLPPYIHRETPTDEDRQRYQTTYAHTPGAVAAPTAGLHFTPEILDACRDRGAKIAAVTLHVGLGTFRPLDVERLCEHRMHREWCRVMQDTIDAVSSARTAGGRVIAVGTTTVRTLESAAATGSLQPFCGETDLFIRPPYTFRAVDALLTNFHLPRSTLVVLLAAFAGREHVLAAYQSAIQQRYRFYSYGDAMFVQ